MVTLPSTRTNRPGVFRAIETIADLLAETLARHGQLRDFYEFLDHSSPSFPVEAGPRPNFAAVGPFRDVKTEENPAR